MSSNATELDQRLTQDLSTLSQCLNALKVAGQTIKMVRISEVLNGSDSDFSDWYFSDKSDGLRDHPAVLKRRLEYLHCNAEDYADPKHLAELIAETEAALAKHLPANSTGVSGPLSTSTSSSSSSSSGTTPALLWSASPSAPTQQQVVQQPALPNEGAASPRGLSSSRNG